MFGSLIATAGAMLSFPHSELVGIHRGLKRGLLKSGCGAITVWYSVRNKVGALAGAVSQVLVNPVSGSLSTFSGHLT